VQEPDSNPDYITVADACALIGGTKPISYATFYRGVKAGLYPKPEHVSAQSVRIRRAKLIEALNRRNGGKS
jgi:predicted DNA-binding transcriptional regulator AlpA